MHWATERKSERTCRRKCEIVEKVKIRLFTLPCSTVKLVLFTTQFHTSHCVCRLFYGRTVVVLFFGVLFLKISIDCFEFFRRQLCSLEVAAAKILRYTGLTSFTWFEFYAFDTSWQHNTSNVKWIPKNWQYQSVRW